MFPKSRVSSEFSATPRGQLNWTGPIANTSDFWESRNTPKIDLKRCFRGSLHSEVSKKGLADREGCREEILPMPEIEA